MRTLVTTTIEGPLGGTLSGRPKGAGANKRLQCQRQRHGQEAAVGSIDAGSAHVGLDTRIRPLPARGIAECLPLLRLENPGHSWLFAGLPHVFELGLAEKTSGYSYIVGSYAALEEDCDAAAFIGAVERHIGGELDLDQGLRTVYDGLFEWDRAFENFGRIGYGRGHALGFYSEALASRAAAGAAPS